MKKENFRLICVSLLLFIVILFTGCVEERLKELNTDANGAAEAVISISQSAKITMIGYTCSKINCGSQVSIQVSFFNKDITRDNFVFVEKGVLIEDLKPVNVRSGDQVKIKVINGCPNAKYTVQYSLDSGS